MVPIQEHVLCFYVAVYNTVLMAKLQGFDQVPEEALGRGFRELALVSNILKEVSPLGQLHDRDFTVTVFKILQQLDYVGMTAQFL